MQSARRWRIRSWYKTESFPVKKGCLRRVRADSRFGSVFSVFDREEKVTMKTLKDAKLGSTVTVVKLHGEGAVKRAFRFLSVK